MIAGPARAGKTTLANIIAKLAFEKGQIPVLASFAGSIKEAANEKGYLKDMYPEKYREFCQHTGATLRAADSDHFVKEMGMVIREAREEEKEALDSKSEYWERVIIIDDVRYSNEVAFGVERDATLIFLSREDVNTEDEWRQHESEELANSVISGENTEVLGLFDHVVENNGSLKDLSKKVKAMVSATSKASGLCDCYACKARRAGRMPEIEEALEELMDMIFDDYECDWEADDDGDA